MNFYDEMERYGSAVAFVEEDGAVHSYAQTVEAADAFGSTVADRGLVFLLADNSLAAATGYIGCLRARVPAALLAGGIPSEQLASLLAAYRPNYLWLPRARAAEVPGAVEVYAQGGYVLLSTGAEPLRAHSDLALLMTTSGSTGSAKFVRLSYGNVAANAASIAAYLKIASEDRAITTLPMHYVFGLSVINSHLHAGARIALTDASLMEKRFWEQVKAQQSTSLSGVPYTYELLKRLRWERMELPDLKVMTQAGGKLSAALVAEFAGHCRQKGMRFYVMYGAAEATARMAYLPSQLALEKPGSIGVPIPGGELWIEDESGNAITRSDVAGELFYRGPNVSLGYARRREDLALGDERGGVLATGDLAQRDADGAYSIVGRKSRFVKLFGNRVNLEEVEHFLRGAGIDCACAGDDALLRIYITNPALGNDAVAAAQRLTQLHPSAFRACVIDSIPRNEAGKIIYAELP
jgi:acyl-CoA synthetase (AMP-forming)/AMP-acid ligase II